MKPIPEKTYRLLFWIGIAIKGVISVGELILGTLLYIFDYTTILKIAYFFTGDEITEAPRDTVWNYVVHAVGGLASSPQSFWAFLFLSHGIVKTILAIGLLKNVLWIYPASAAVFAGFVVYQAYQYTYAPSFMLAAITIFDIVLIGLIIHEYRYKLKHA